MVSDLFPNQVQQGNKNWNASPAAPTTRSTPEVFQLRSVSAKLFPFGTRSSEDSLLIFFILQEFSAVVWIRALNTEDWAGGGVCVRQISFAVLVLRGRRRKIRATKSEVFHRVRSIFDSTKVLSFSSCFNPFPLLPNLPRLQGRGWVNDVIVMS